MGKGVFSKNSLMSKRKKLIISFSSLQTGSDGVIQTYVWKRWCQIEIPISSEATLCWPNALIDKSSLHID